MACELNLNQVIEATKGESLAVHAKSFFGVGTDTREALSDQIFIALRGDNFDAHNFLQQAVKQGAKCLIVDKDTTDIEELKTKVSIVKVKDTLKALQDLARFWRRRVKAKVFGITGSQGKTSTKEFAAVILSTQFKVHYSRGSYNNHWGVPLTLLGISQFDDVAIVEMGMNHKGELTALSKIAEPDVVVCTTVGRAHIGNFGGSEQAIADAKEEIYLANPKAQMIFNYDNEYTLKMFERVSKLQGTERTIVFSTFAAGSEVSLRASMMTIDGLKVSGHIAGVRNEVTVPLFGRHNVVNLMAASCMAIAMQMQPEHIWAALPKCRAEWGRGQVFKLQNGPTIIFDAYNANPDSVAMLIKNLLELNLPEGGKKVAVLADMLELGEKSAELHTEIGEMIGNTDVEIIWFIGAQNAAFSAGVKNSMFSKKLMVTESYELDVALNLRSMLNPQDIVVIKGSRGMKLERVVQAWDSQFKKH